MASLPDVSPRPFSVADDHQHETLPGEVLRPSTIDGVAVGVADLFA